VHTGDLDGARQIRQEGMLPTSSMVISDAVVGDEGTHRGFIPLEAGRSFSVFRG